MSDLTIAVVPSTDTFEAHFAPLGVAPEDMASGQYRGTWITRYAEDLQRLCGIRCVLVAPSRSTGRWSGQIMDVHLTPLPTAYPTRLRPALRGPIRPMGSYLSSTLLARDLAEYPVVYVQEYAYGRAAALVAAGLGERMIAAYQGTSIERAPRWVRQRLPQVNVLTAVTKQETDKVNAAIRGRGRARVTCIPNWVEDAWFQWEPKAGRPVIPRVLWCGRLDDRHKDLRTLLEGFRRLRNKRPAELLLVGDGPDRSALEGVVESDETLRGSVRFTGRLDDAAALQALVVGADVVVSTSRVEGFPLAVLEAGASGRPLVLSSLPYTEDLVGLPSLWRFAVGDVESLALQLGTALDSDKDPQAQSAWIKDRYSAHSSVMKLGNLIKDVAGVATGRGSR